MVTEKESTLVEPNPGTAHLDQFMMLATNIRLSPCEGTL